MVGNREWKLKRGSGGTMSRGCPVHSTEDWSHILTHEETKI
jgi:hypothetical protein